MASGDDFQGLVLKGITKLDHKELGRGAYGKVYAVNYHGTICAAKEVHSILVEEVGEVEMRRTVESFMRECHQCSKLRHPNIIQFLGVYYSSAGAGSVQGRMRLPVMVMEMMADSLTSLVDKHEKIPVHIKFSIVHDVSLGLCYLHNHDPPIVHRDLSPNNILLTAHHVAKVSDLGVAKVINIDSKKTLTKAPGTVDFMPPESLSRNPVYGPPMDVFSFAGIVLHTFNQEWPHPTELVEYDHKTRKMVALSEVERRQQYLDKLTGEVEVLRPLVEECLDYDPAIRPTIASICERIQVSKDGYMKESPKDVISLYQQVARKNTEIEQLKFEVDQLKLENDNLKHQPDANPFTPTLTRGRYYTKWTQLANLPSPMYGAYTAVQDKKIYVAGGNSPVNVAMLQVYVYDINTDHWGHLPPPGHYYGVPHIVGGKLALFGGRLSHTYKRTNKVSTFDQTSYSWKSHFPDLLSVRSKPGVTTHLEHVIVAGGGLDDTIRAQGGIEILNWVENSHWREVSINLPVPMSVFTPIIADDHLVIVGYVDVNNQLHSDAYKIPVVDITRSGDQQHQTTDTPIRWITMSSADHVFVSLVPNSSPPVIVGGEDQSGSPTSDIKVYDESSKSWKDVTSLSCARSQVALAAVNNTIIVIGGYIKGGSTTNSTLSSMVTVEVGLLK